MVPVEVMRSNQAPKKKVVDDARIALLDEVVNICKIKYVDGWNIHYVCFARRVPIECISNAHERADMVPGTPACRMGQYGQANTLHLIQRHAPPDCGFVMKEFQTPGGRSIGHLCVLCLRLIMARDGQRFWQMEGNMVFRALAFRYENGKITF